MKLKCFNVEKNEFNFLIIWFESFEEVVVYQRTGLGVNYLKKMEKRVICGINFLNFFFFLKNLFLKVKRLVLFIYY